MDINSLTQKSQEALAEAQSIATRMGHTEVDGEHLLLALIDQPEGLVPRLLDQTGADTAVLRADLERELNRRPKVSGPGATPGQVSITRRLAQLLEAQKMETIGHLTGGVAHDFNNLLMAMLGSLELLKKRVPDDPSVGRLIDNAIKAVERGAALTQRLLAFAPALGALVEEDDGAVALSQGT